MSIFPHICNILSNFLIKVEKNYTFPLEMTQKKKNIMRTVMGR